MTQPTLRILGIRGLPAAHGGFETFAERLALHLVAAGWRVVVYCQHEGRAPVHVDHWQGVERVNVSVAGDGPRSTMSFDWQCIRHAAKHRDLCLTLGYNTAAFCAWLKLHGVRNVINMDGIEWARAKWGPAARAWFWLNELAGCLLGDVLVADHPEIKTHLSRHASPQRIAMIPYGSDRVLAQGTELLGRWGLEPGRYLTVIARPEPENSLLEIVQAFSRRPRGHQLVVLGRYDSSNAYHQAVQAAASNEVKFIGPVYAPEQVKALRVNGVGYLHGHQVGGTNPSLVEALGAGNPVLAHDNRFNRWVAGDAALYFSSVDELDASLQALLTDVTRQAALHQAALQRHAAEFTWQAVLDSYTTLLRANLR